MDNNEALEGHHSSSLHRHLTRQSTAWTRPSVANSTTPLISPSLNLDQYGKPLTFSSALRGENKDRWVQAEFEEICRLIDTKTIRPILITEQPLDRRGDTTYYNPKPKEKINANGEKTYRIRGTIGGNLINYPGNTAARTSSSISHQ
jgi:hypothetical protein